MISVIELSSPYLSYDLSYDLPSAGLAGPAGHRSSLDKTEGGARFYTVQPSPSCCIDNVINIHYWPCLRISNSQRMKVAAV